MRIWLLGAWVFACWTLWAPLNGAADELPLPSTVAKVAVTPDAAAVAEILRGEPFTRQSWPQWRLRLLSWIGDRSQATDAAFDAAREFFGREVGEGQSLPEWLNGDAYAWYVWNGALMRREAADPAARHKLVDQAEAAIRRSLELDPQFARAHRNLATTLINRGMIGPRPGALAAQEPDFAAIQQSLDTAVRLEPDLPLSFERGLLAFVRKDYVGSERLFRQALVDYPDQPGIVKQVARAVSSQGAPTAGRTWASAVEPLVQQFPDDTELRAHLTLALARDGRFVDAADQIERIRKLGGDPAEFLGQESVNEIESGALPGRLTRWPLWGVGGYLAIMALMAVGGVLLAARTRGAKAIDLLARPTEELVQFGQVARGGRESLLARLYMLGLMVGLVTFYIAVPFLALGLLVATGAALYMVFMLPRIPIKLIVIVVVIGLGMAWAVLKSIFTSAGRGSFGLVKTADDCPRLHEIVRSVAQRVDTAPVDEIYLAPGSSIGVHQEGRGPFGVFGVKRRVLTLGMSTMRYLSISELKAILAHEYGHFSHNDTFYSRFIQQVTLSIEQALIGMAQTAGKLNYINPFYWLLYLYYRAYSLLAAGFSRSREFLADRMAVSLYGKVAFCNGLTKVATDGTLFENTAYGEAARLLEEDKAFLNVYDVFQAYHDDEAGGAERQKLYDQLLEDKGSLFASHPTFRERIEAVMPFPETPPQETAPAIEIFEQPEEIEKELTEFLTGYVNFMRRLQMQAALE